MFDSKAQDQLRAAQKVNRRHKPRQLKEFVFGKSGGGKYKGRKKTTFHYSTLYRNMRKIGYIGRGTKVRPKITDKVAKERVKCARYLLNQRGEEANRVKVDEKIFVLPGITGTLSFHPDSETDTPEVEAELFRKIGHKRHPPKIMVIAGVAKPVLKEGWKSEKDMWEKRGLVFIARCQRRLPALVGKKKRGRDGKVVFGEPGPRGGKKPEYMHKKGDLIEVDVNARKTKGLDGKLYADMYIGEGEYSGRGLLEDIKEYGGGCLTELQEDGAPGHGYANTRKGKFPTVEHKRFDVAARKVGIKIYKQSANSPCMNDDDLGVWWALEAAVIRRSREFLQDMSKSELLDKMFKVIQEEFWALAPESLFSIAEHKVDIAEEVIKRKGKAIGKEPHAGARKRTARAI